VVTFTPRLLYPQGKILRYSLDRRLGGPQNWSGREEEWSLSLPGIEPRSCPAHIEVTSLTELTQCAVELILDVSTAFLKGKVPVLSFTPR
jgi:hypothetical protein